jgi:arylsulfatase
MQHDAAYLQLEEMNGDQWAKADAEAETRLKALREKHGKAPNIVFILADDIGHADIGCYGGGKMRGAPTPHLDRMAAEGMKWLGFYSEPSCTPSRVGIMTGRHPVRTGLTQVLWPGSTQGLHPEEVTIATLLSEAGYRTAMHGKWHLGDASEHQPQNHGFDYAYFTLFNAAPYVFADKEFDFFEWPESREFRDKYPIEGLLEARKGEKARELKEMGLQDVLVYDAELADKTVEFIQEHAHDEEPFFVYHCASKLDYWGPHPDWAGKSPGGFIVSDQLVEHDHNVGRILQAIRDEGIEENTLVVWMSDNGPMYQAGPKASGYHWLRGGKGDVLEGGMRVPGIAWWPGTIEPGQDPGPMDIVSITDLFTTAARLGGVKDKIPNDRVTDGVDQTCLLLHGEGHSHRDYMFYYSGAELGAVRKQHLKNLKGVMHGGLPTNQVFNILADPREEHSVPSDFMRYLSLAVPFQDFVTEHMKMIEKFPHRVLAPSPGAGIIDHD